MKTIYISLVFLALLSCGKTTELEKIEAINPNEIVIQKEQFKSENMQLGTLKKHSFLSSLKTTGIIDVPPDSRAMVSSFAGGYIKEIPLLIGDKVKKGEVIATLTNTSFVELQQEFLEVDAQLKYLQNEYKRQQKLFAQKISSEKKFIKAESDYKSMVAKYQGLEKKLRMMKINIVEVKKGVISETIALHAPISGYVTKIFTNKGAYVSDQNNVLEIINTNHIHLELNVFEKDILQVKKGQEITFTVPEASTKIFKGEVYLVGTNIEENRTVKVHGHVEEKEQNFLSGMFVESNIIFEKKEALAVPKTALINDGEVDYILIKKEEKEKNYIFVKQHITIVNSDDTHVQVKEQEVLADKTILIAGGFML